MFLNVFYLSKTQPTFLQFISLARFDKFEIKDREKKSFYIIVEFLLFLFIVYFASCLVDLN